MWRALITRFELIELSKQAGDAKRGSDPTDAVDGSGAYSDALAKIRDTLC